MDKVLFSSSSEEWSTPSDFFNKLDQIYHFTLDACASSVNHKCANYFSKSDNALNQDWSGNVVFCNPPYGKDLYKWVEKSYLESLKPNTKVVMLIPSRTDTRWFHDFVLPFGQFNFVRGRLRFGGSINPAPFPSLVVVF